MNKKSFTVTFSYQGAMLKAVYTAEPISELKPPRYQVKFITPNNDIYNLTYTLNPRIGKFENIEKDANIHSAILEEIAKHLAVTVNTK